MVYVSTQSLTSSLRQSIQQAQSQLLTVQQEVASQRVADLGLSLGVQTGRAISLSQQSDSLTAYGATNASVTTRLSSTTSVLDGLTSSAQALANSLITVSSGGVLTAAIQNLAQGGLQSLIAGLNTSIGGQNIFAGIKTNQPPIGDYFAAGSPANAAVVAAIADPSSGVSSLNSNPSSITGPQIQNFLNTTFNNLFQTTGPAPNWSTWSSASNTALKSQIAPGQTVDTSVSANDQAFRNIAQAYTILTEFGDKGLSADATQAVISTASKLLNTGLGQLNQVEAGVGVAQSSIDDANTHLTAQIAIITNSVNNLEGVDPYALSVKVTALQNQLQASYQLTAQLKSLSLVNYLTGG